MMTLISTVPSQKNTKGGKHFSWDSGWGVGWGYWGSRSGSTAVLYSHLSYQGSSREDNFFVRNYFWSFVDQKKTTTKKKALYFYSSFINPYQMKTTKMDVGGLHGWGVSTPRCTPVIVPKVHCSREGFCISSQFFFSNNSANVQSHTKSGPN